MSPAADGVTTAIDVGVVTYNTRELTVSALQALVMNCGDTELRLMVFDNASSDGTVEAIRQQVPRAEVIASDVNVGYGRAMNELIAKSTAPWFLAINSDAWPEAGACRRCFALASSAPTSPRLRRGF